MKTLNPHSSVIIKQEGKYLSETQTKTTQTWLHLRRLKFLVSGEKREEFDSKKIFFQKSNTGIIKNYTCFYFKVLVSTIRKSY